MSLAFLHPAAQAAAEVCWGLEEGTQAATTSTAVFRPGVCNQRVVEEQVWVQFRQLQEEQEEEEEEEEKEQRAKIFWT